MMRILGILFSCAVMMCGMGAAHADKRIALLIGNASYSDTIGPLDNPENDLELVKSTLMKTGFSETDIVVVRNADRHKMLTELDAFTKRVAVLGSNDVALFYYSGHGAKKPGEKGLHLIPVDAENIADVSFWFDTVSFDQRVLDALEKTNSQAALVVSIDACRNELKLPIRALASGDKGFGTIPSAAGMLISFAADDNQTARDYVQNGGEKSVNSPYALALSEELLKPGRTLSSAFGAVRPNVMSRTERIQQPTLMNKLNWDPVLVSSIRPAVDQEDRDWQRLSVVGRSGIETYLSLYPNGKYATDAKNMLARITPDIDPTPQPTPMPTPTPNVSESTFEISGMRVRDVTGVVSNFFDLKGVYVEHVTPDSAAEKIGLSEGAIVQEVNFEPVTDLASFKQALQEAAQNNRKEVLLSARLGAVSSVLRLPLSSETDRVISSRVLGMTLRPLTEADNAALGLKPGTTGAYVTAIQPDSPAANANLKPDVALVSVSFKKVTSLEMLESEIKSLQSAGRNGAMLSLKAKGSSQVTLVKF